MLVETEHHANVIYKLRYWNNVFKFLYWAKVLPEQWASLQIFRTHDIFRTFLKMHFDQAIIHLSKSLNFILITCLQITSFDYILEVPTQNVRPQSKRY